METDRSVLIIKKCIEGKLVSMEEIPNYNLGFERLKSYLLDTYGAGSYRIFIYDVEGRKRKLISAPMVNIYL